MKRELPTLPNLNTKNDEGGDNSVTSYFEKGIDWEPEPTSYLIVIENENKDKKRIRKHVEGKLKSKIKIPQSIYNENNSSGKSSNSSMKSLYRLDSTHN